MQPFFILSRIEVGNIQAFNLRHLREFTHLKKRVLCTCRAIILEFRYLMFEICLFLDILIVNHAFERSLLVFLMKDPLTEDGIDRIVIHGHGVRGAQSSVVEVTQRPLIIVRVVIFVVRIICYHFCTRRSFLCISASSSVKRLSFI
jgi:hypothetical protein